MGFVQILFKYVVILQAISTISSLDKTDEKENTATLEFEQNEYTIIVNNEQTGTIIHFKTKTNANNVEYELVIDDTKDEGKNLKSNLELNKTTGDLKIIKKLAIGEYTLEVLAKKDKESAKAKAKIIVEDSTAKQKTALEFEEKEYTINIYNDQTGEIAHFKTKSSASNTEYELVIDETKDEGKTLKKCLELGKSTGVLKITQKLAVAEYALEVSAKQDKESIKANVKIIVKDASTRPTEAPKVPLEFEEKEYIIKAYNDQTGVIEQFKTKTSSSNVEYELVIDVKEVASKTLSNSLEIDKSTGVLKIKEKLTAGEYTFEVLAKREKESVKVKAKLIVKEVAVCEDKNNSPFSYAFLKIFAKAKSNDTIFTVNNSSKSCEYFIYNQQPKGEFFILDPNKGALMTNNIDIQQEAFQNQVQPHIRLEILAKCKPRNRRDVGSHWVDNDRDEYTRVQHEFKTSNIQTLESQSLHSNPNDSKTDGDDKHIEELPCVTKKTKGTCDSMVDNIVYNPTTMQLLVIFHGSSGNVLEFQEKSYFMGYPEKKLFPQITPETIGHVQLATKEDDAEVKYSVNNTKEVISDPCTGKLYPSYAHFTYKALEFDVVATYKSGKADSLNKTVPVKVGILQGHHIMKLLVKKRKVHSGLDVITKLEESLSATVKVLRKATVPSMEEMSGSIELNTEGFEILEYLIVYAFHNNKFLDMNEQVTYVKNNKDLKGAVIWINVLAATPHHYYQSKGFISTLVVIMLILCVTSLVFYITYIRTGKYYRFLNYFKKTRTNTTTPLDTDQVSTGTSDYVVSFARMNFENPSFNIVEVEPGAKDTKDMFTPVTLKAYENPQIINVDDLAPPPPILVNSNNNSRRNSAGGEDSLGLPIGGETKVRRKSTVSFNEIVEQFQPVRKD